MLQCVCVKFARISPEATKKESAPPPGDGEKEIPWPPSVVDASDPAKSWMHSNRETGQALTIYKLLANQQAIFMKAIAAAGSADDSLPHPSTEQVRKVAAQTFENEGKTYSNWVEYRILLHQEAIYVKLQSIRKRSSQVAAPSRKAKYGWTPVSDLGKDSLPKPLPTLMEAADLQRKGGFAMVCML